MISGDDVHTNNLIECRTSLLGRLPIVFNKKIRTKM